MTQTISHMKSANMNVSPQIVRLSNYSRDNAHATDKLYQFALATGRRYFFLRNQLIIGILAWYWCRLGQGAG